jgi:hypothetical protein
MDEKEEAAFYQLLEERLSDPNFQHRFERRLFEIRRRLAQEETNSGAVPPTDKREQRE